MPLPSPRILIVDDEHDILSALKRVLVRRGYVVSSANNAAEALAHLDAFDPEVIVSDFHMPGMNGGELLAAASARLPYARLVLLSGYADMEKVEGVAVVAKPWSEEELLGHCMKGALR